MSQTLVTFLGGRDVSRAGCREATYRFGGGTCCTTNFFGMALAEHLKCRLLARPSACAIRSN
jgi:hypothetical protein